MRLIDEEAEPAGSIARIKRHVNILESTELVKSAEEAFTRLRELDVVDEDLSKRLHALVTRRVRRLLLTNLVFKRW